MRAAAALHRARPDVRFLVASFRPHQQQMVDEYLRRHPGLPIDTHVGRTPEIIELSHACLAVSGSVSLELLYRVKPTVVVYRIGRLDMRVCNYFKTSPYICLVNLLAGQELYPEFLTDHCQATAMSRHLLTWLDDAPAYAATCAALSDLRDRVAVPGACARTAAAILETLSAGGRRAA
jgi:lipid-A-disaccharide synthase